MVRRGGPGGANSATATDNKLATMNHWKVSVA